jgi:hypothetical protein
LSNNNGPQEKEDGNVGNESTSQSQAAETAGPFLAPPKAPAAVPSSLVQAVLNKSLAEKSARLQTRR